MTEGIAKTEVQLRDAVSVARAIENAIDPVVGLTWLVALGISTRQPLNAFAVISTVMVFAFTYPGRIRLTDSAVRVAVQCCITALTIDGGLMLLGMAAGWFERMTRDELMPWILALPLTLLGTHLCSRAVLPRLLSISNAHATAVICGANEIGTALAGQFLDNPYLGIELIGFFDDRAPERMRPGSDRPLLGSFDDLGEYVRKRHVDRIYLALPMASQPRILKILDDLKDSTASLYFVLDIFVTEIINGRFESVAGMPVVAVRDTPFSSVVSSAVKRAEDIVLSSLMLLAAAPLMALIALVIRIQSPGPALFRQRRYGLDGRDIVVYKFRTMTVAEDGDSEFTAVKKGDARVTALGQFLRRTSMDELPQLFNVLQGRMSLVGPRPHVVAMNEQFRKLIPGYMLRHKIKPGITGLAQVRGLRGGDNLDDMAQRISSDLEYLRHWSLGLDLMILARTVLVVLGDRRAY